MKAVVLAAGKGDRFFPFAVFRPKPMFPICNRPLLEWLIERIVSAGITEIGIVIGHRGGRIRNHFGNGNRFGCAITYIEQSDPKGTAHAICQSADFIGEDNFLVVHGDLFLGPQTIPQLLDAFQDQNPPPVAGVHHTDHLESCIRPHIDKAGNITNYTWKPRGGEGLALMGIYVFPSTALPDLANTSDFVPNAQFGIFPPEGQEIFDALPLMHREGRPALAVELEGPWFDMDLPWEPQHVTRLAVREMAEALTDSVIAKTATVDPNAQITGPIFLDEGSHITRDAYITGPAWIGKNTRILEGTHISGNTVIGDQCVIGPYAKVSGTVGFDCRITNLGEFSGLMLCEGRVTHQIQLSGIFGERAEIGAGTQVGTLRFDDAEIEVEVQGIRRKAPGFTGALFGDYSRTGIGTMLMPGRIIGPCAMVGPGVVLMKNAPPYKAVLLKQDLEEIDWGPEIYDR